MQHLLFIPQFQIFSLNTLPIGDKKKYMPVPTYFLQMEMSFSLLFRDSAFNLLNIPSDR